MYEFFALIDCHMHFFFIFFFRQILEQQPKLNSNSLASSGRICIKIPYFFLYPWKGLFSLKFSANFHGIFCLKSWKVYSKRYVWNVLKISHLGLFILIFEIQLEEEFYTGSELLNTQKLYIFRIRRSCCQITKMYFDFQFELVSDFSK